jgi:phosphatidylglycerol:prolipoprotein diacylglycerol transferase
MTTESVYWVHNWSPFLFRFPENPLGLDGIRYYGLSYLLGFLGAWWLLRCYNARGRFMIDAEARSSLMTALILGVLIGGRLGYMLLYDLTAFMANPLLFFRVDQGGMASHGGFIGVTIALAWFARKRYRFFELSDIIVTLAPLGLCLGRIANFINGELWGRVTQVSWAVIFPKSPAIYDPTNGIFAPQARHPSQLYQAILEGALLFAYVQWRFWKKRPAVGQLGGEFLIVYGFMRIIGECFREPDASLLFGMSRGQFYSTFLILAGIIIISLARKKNN